MVQEVDTAPSPEQKVKDTEVAFWHARHFFLKDRLYLKDKSRRSSELRRALFNAICESSNGIATMSTDLGKWAATLQIEAKPLFDHLSDEELSSSVWTFEHISLAIKERRTWQDPVSALLDIKVSLSQADHMSGADCCLLCRTCGLPCSSSSDLCGLVFAVLNLYPLFFFPM